MTGAQYAAGTAVPVGRTRDEIERTLSKYGAIGFAFGQEPGRAAVAFTIRDRQVRFTIPLPDVDEFAKTPKGQRRNAATAASECDKATRARWRALSLIVKAKLEAIAAGVVSFDDEFGMQLVMPDGRTVSEAIGPQLAAALDSGQLPALLPGSPR